MEPETPFLRLPLEIRNLIYELVFRPYHRPPPVMSSSDWEEKPLDVRHKRTRLAIDLHLLRTNRQIHFEAREVCFKVNCFVHLITNHGNPLRTYFESWNLQPISVRPAQSSLVNAYQFAMRIHLVKDLARTHSRPTSKPQITHFVLLAGTHLRALGAAIADRTLFKTNDLYKHNEFYIQKDFYRNNPVHIGVELLSPFESMPDTLRQQIHKSLLSPLSELWCGFSKFKLSGVFSASLAREVMRIARTPQSYEGLFKKLQVMATLVATAKAKKDWQEVLSRAQDVLHVANVHIGYRFNIEMLMQPQDWQRVVGSVVFDAILNHAEACMELLKQEGILSRSTSRIGHIFEYVACTVAASRSTGLLIGSHTLGLIAPGFYVADDQWAQLMLYTAAADRMAAEAALIKNDVATAEDRLGTALYGIMQAHGLQLSDTSILEELTTIRAVIRRYARASAPCLIMRSFPIALVVHPDGKYLQLRLRFMRLTSCSLPRQTA